MSAGQQEGALDRLPWRGPGPGRPVLPLPPGPMPLRSHGAIRKRWRYVGLYGPEVMLCAARVQIGPFSHSFWTIWDRDRGRSWGQTRFRPGGREVVLRGPEVEVNGREAEARLRLGDAAPVESICPSGAGWAWTRKRAGVPVTGTLSAGGRHWEIDGAGVDDESAGYHQRHTSWHWSAGIGRAADGRAVAWNLVSGLNDPPRSSERGIWVDGIPREPEPVDFDGLRAVVFGDRGKLCFNSGSERARDDNLLLVRSRYRHRFGTFSGSLDGIELAEGFGVMEVHEAVW